MLLIHPLFIFCPIKKHNVPRISRSLAQVYCISQTEGKYFSSMHGPTTTVNKVYVLIHYVQPNVNYFQSPCLYSWQTNYRLQQYMVGCWCNPNCFLIYLFSFSYLYEYITHFGIYYNPKLFDIFKRSATSSKIYISFALLVLHRPWILSDLSDKFLLCLTAAVAPPERKLCCPNWLLSCPRSLRQSLNISRHLEYDYLFRHSL
jgi:hypothetical protein